MLGFSPCGNLVAVGMYMWFAIVLLLRTSSVSSALPPVPSFAEPIPNITITAGREAVLQCVVDNLGVHRVIWVKVDTQTLLTYHTQVIIHNNRITINAHGLRNWDLHIKHIQAEDRGLYMCQVNTSPMISRYAHVEVVVPPDIIYNQTSSDFAVPEGSNATLVCRATGYPPPKLSWRREDGEPIYTERVGLEKKHVYTTVGDTLFLQKITRRNMGAYLCIATNDIPPAVSKRINLQVNFEPAIKAPSQMIGAPAGGDVVMECLVEASPRSINYWEKVPNNTLFSSEKYEVQQHETLYKMHMLLKIRQLERSDFGKYKCKTENSMGKAEGDIQLHELHQIVSVKSKVDSDDSRISFRIEEHIGGNDSASSLYKTSNSKRNPMLGEGLETPYTDKESNRPRGGNTADGENDVHYPSAKKPPVDDTGSCAGRLTGGSVAIWCPVLCFALTLSYRTTIKRL